MRRSSLFLILCLTLCLSFGLANGQSSTISVTAITGTFGSDGPDLGTFPDTLRTGQNIKFTIHYLNSTGFNMVGATNGWVVYSTDGAIWDSTKLDTLAIGTPGWRVRSDLALGFYPVDTVNISDTLPHDAGDTTILDPVPEGTDTNGFVANGAPPDTVGLSLSSSSSPHFENGFNKDAVSITLKAVSSIYSGKHICLDTAVYSVAANAWLWGLTGGGSSIPDWHDEPLCFTLYQVPNECPNFTNCPSGFTGNHCLPATITFSATDPETNPISFHKISGPGTVTAGGVWNYAPNIGDVGVALSLVVGATDGVCGDTTVCTVPLTFTNICPSFTDGCGDTTAVGKGNSETADVDGASNDCDPIGYSLGTVTPTPFGTYSINSAGTVTFNTLETDGGIVYTFPVIVSDGKCADTCNVYFNVLVVEPYRVQIEKTHETIQGTHELVCVTLNGGSEEMWGFDFLIAYDNSALSLVAAIAGNLYADCGWEYFNWRFGANGNCSNACPSGLVRVVGLAETNNGPNHPQDWALCATLPIQLFCLDFLVTNDRTFECQYVPIRFFWVDCGDNSISYNPSDDPTGLEQRLAVSRAIYDFDFFAGDISNGSTGFPTYYGVQDYCLEGGGEDKPAPVAFIDFINGGIDIVCADSIDDRGDINLNGLSNEVADAVLFTNYFIYGLAVFTVNVQGQIAATDINADGLVLSVADLVYIIRIVIGDALPYAKLAPVESIVKIDKWGTLSISNVQVGAAAIVLEGDVKPTLLATNMRLEYAYDVANNVTRSIIYSMEKGQSFSGEFFNTKGAEIVGIEMATSEGAPILAKEVELPTEFALNQNYPNPFNPKTRISFALPTASDYTLTIYNVTGQKVTEFTGSAQAGTVDIDVDAANYSSGVYFYKLIADNGRFTETKKMVLVK